MKKYVYLLTITIASLLIVSMISVASASELEKVKFVHYKKGTDGVKDLSATSVTALKPRFCYSLMGVKLTTPTDYQINPSNTQGLSESFITTAITNSAMTWDLATKVGLFNSPTINYTTTYETFDGINAISFGSNPDPNVIAETTMWSNSQTKKVVEFDIQFDNDWAWGDAVINPNVMDVMDLQNIATHEFGHAVGLADLYNTCTEETMYGYSGYGETIKRTLNKGDISGLKAIYETNKIGRVGPRIFTTA